MLKRLTFTIDFILRGGGNQDSCLTDLMAGPWWERFAVHSSKPSKVSWNSVTFVFVK